MNEFDVNVKKTCVLELTVSEVKLCTKPGNDKPSLGDFLQYYVEKPPLVGQMH